MYSVHKIGEFELITLLDGIFLCGPEFIPAAGSKQGADLFESVGLPATGPSPEPINAFALKRNDQVWLIDAGCGRELGPRFGKAPAALLSAGIAPEQVSGVILTHLHEDHIGGLIREDGSALYPDATLFLAEKELAFWSDPHSPEKFPHIADAGLFRLAHSVLQAYQQRVTSIADSSPIIPDVHFVALPGHTPGHSGVQINAGAQSILIWGDVVHSALLQLRYPHWSIGFDMDPLQAVQTREKLLARLAGESTLVAGPHISGVGRICSCCSGGYQLQLAQVAAASQSFST